MLFIIAYFVDFYVASTQSKSAEWSAQLTVSGDYREAPKTWPLCYIASNFRNTA